LREVSYVNFSGKIEVYAYTRKKDRINHDLNTEVDSVNAYREIG
jgi:hypothetical protein